MSPHEYQASRYRLLGFLAVGLPFAVPVAVFVYGIFLIVVASTYDDEGLASGIASQATGEWAAIVIFADLLLVLPVALLVSWFLGGLVDRAEMRAIERSR